MDFTSDIKEIDEVTREVEIRVPLQQLTDGYEKEAKRLSKTVTLKGFRPGKAPAQVVKRVHGEAIWAQVVQQSLEASLEQFLGQAEFDPVGQPEVDITTWGKKEDLVYTVKISIYPTPTIKDFDAFEIEVPKKDPTDEDVEKVLSDVRESRPIIEVITDRSEVQDGDVVQGTMKITVDGEEEGNEEVFIGRIGDKDFDTELESELIGAKVNEEKSFTITHGEEAKSQKLRGKKCHYVLTVSEIKSRTLPELNDEFAAEISEESKTVEELRAEVLEGLKKRVEQEVESATIDAILTQLGERNPFVIPQVLIDNEIRMQLVQAGMLDSSKYDISRFPVDSLREQFGPMGEKRVRSSISVDKIAEQENIEVSEEDVTAFLERFIEGSKYSMEEVRKELLSDRRAKETRGEIRRDKVIELLKSRTKVTFVEPKEPESSKVEASSSTAA